MSARKPEPFIWLHAILIVFPLLPFEVPTYEHPNRASAASEISSSKSAFMNIISFEKQMDRKKLLKKQPRDKLFSVRFFAN